MDDSKILLQNTLMSTSWNISNVKLARYFKSNDASILLGNLISKDSYFEKHNSDYKGWFFNTVEQIEKDTACSERTQRRIFELFKSLNLVDIKLKGLPAKRYFKINYYALKALISDSSCETSELDTAKRKNKLLRNAIPILNKIQDIKEEKKKNIKKEKFVVASQFDEFWKIYHKGTKSKALQAWLKVCELPKKSTKVSRPKWKEIKKAIDKQLQSERWTQQPNYIPHTSSWLNGYMWLNDAKDLTIIVDFNQTKRNNSVGYQGGFQLTKESIKM